MLNADMTEERKGVAEARVMVGDAAAVVPLAGLDYPFSRSWRSEAPALPAADRLM